MTQPSRSFSSPLHLRLQCISQPSSLYILLLLLFLFEKCISFLTTCPPANPNSRITSVWYSPSHRSFLGGTAIFPTTGPTKKHGQEHVLRPRSYRRIKTLQLSSQTQGGTRVEEEEVPIENKSKISLNELILLQNRTKTLLSAPSITRYWLKESRHIMVAWSKNPKHSSALEGAKYIEALLKKIIDTCKYDKEIRYTLRAEDGVQLYDIWMEGWANSIVSLSHPADDKTVGEDREYMWCIAERVEEILDYRIAQSASPDNDDDDDGTDNVIFCQPSVKSFYIVLQTWSMLPHPEAAERAERVLLEKMRHPHRIKPHIECYNAVINAWCRAEFPRHAERFLASMADNGVEPNENSFLPIIHAWGQRSVHDKLAAYRANLLLVKMEGAIHRSVRSNRPRGGKNRQDGTLLLCYAAVLRSYCYSPPPSPTAAAKISSPDEEGRDNAKRAHSILKRMERKLHDILSEDGDDPASEWNIRIYYNMVLNAYANCGHAEEAEDLLSHMEKNNMANSFSYNRVLHALGVKKGDRTMASRAERILNQMEKLYKDRQKRERREDEQNGPDMENVIKPSTVGFNIVIKAWCWSGGKKGAVRAERLLHRMERLYQNGEVGMKPDVRSYAPVMNAWSRCREGKSADKAYYLLQTMESAGSTKPDKKCYTTVIGAYCKSNRPNKAIRAQKLLQEMDQSYKEGNVALKPDLFVFNSVMNACAFYRCNNLSDDRQRALDITYRTFKDLEDNASDYGVPDHVIYTTFLKACRNLTPMDRSRMQIVKAIVRKCKREGHVSTIVLRELRRSIPDIFFWELLLEDSDGDGLVGYFDTIEQTKIPSLQCLPSKWSRNVGRYDKM